jgi:sulfur-oxidizing protein SoxA
MKLPDKLLLLLSALLLALPATDTLAVEPRSGYDYIKQSTRDMQDDDFENPGMLTLEQGRQLFNTIPEGQGKSCTACHGSEAEDLDVTQIARYPVHDGSGLLTLQEQISSCRENNGGSILPIDHPELIALETFVRNRAAGEAINVQTDGAMAPLLEKGEQLYSLRYGLIDMSCQHCHDYYPGQRIRGQTISQGMGNGFPAYRLDIGEITNLHQRIQQCLLLMRAEPFAAGSEEIKLMGLYIMSRSNGLKIETPAVRY